MIEIFNFSILYSTIETVQGIKEAALSQMTDGGEAHEIRPYFAFHCADGRYVTYQPERATEENFNHYLRLGLALIRQASALLDTQTFVVALETFNAAIPDALEVTTREKGCGTGVLRATIPYAIVATEPRSIAWQPPIVMPVPQALCGSYHFHEANHMACHSESYTCSAYSTKYITETLGGVWTGDQSLLDLLWVPTPA